MEGEMKKISLIVCIALILFSAAAQATPVTLVNQGDTWNYAVLNNDLWSNWGASGYSSFDWV
jgi:hypothetical protein